MRNKTRHETAEALPRLIRYRRVSLEVVRLAENNRWRRI
jgi:hypothetical protein